MLERLYDFYAKHMNTPQGEFFTAMAEEFACSTECARAIWYAEQRSWFDEDMIAELIRLDKENLPLPLLTTGEFTWKDGKFS